MTTDNITLIQAAEQALEALKVWSDACLSKYGQEAITNLTAAIEAAKNAEPVRCCLHDSDCAVHNEPAYPAGPCNCSLKQNEPVGYYSGKDGEYGYDIVQLYEDVPQGTKLYTTPQPAVPEGMVLVPVKPTEKMKKAAAGELYVGRIYRAMLAAAPKGGNE